MQIQVENFLKIENEQMKIAQNNSYGQKLSETTNQGVEIMNSKRQLKRKQHLFVYFESNMFWARAAFTV